MKIPGVNKKITVDAEHEPELYAINELNPLPGRPNVHVNLLLPTSLLRSNNRKQSRISAGTSNISSQNNSTYGTQLSDDAVAQGIVNARGGSVSAQTQAFVSLSSIYGRTSLYSHLQAILISDSTSRTDAATLAAANLASNLPSARVRYNSQDLLSFAVL